MQAQLYLRLYSPAVTQVLSAAGRIPAPLACIQVRGKKQKFGGATRDPFKSLQRKLARRQQMKHAKVPLISEEKAQATRLAPIIITSIGKELPKHECRMTCQWDPYRSAGGYLYSTGEVCKSSTVHQTGRLEWCTSGGWGMC